MSDTHSPSHLCFLCGDPPQAPHDPLEKGLASRFHGAHAGSVSGAGRSLQNESGLSLVSRMKEKILVPSNIT